MGDDVDVKPNMIFGAKHSDGLRTNNKESNNDWKRAFDKFFEQAWYAFFTQFRLVLFAAWWYTPMDSNYVVKVDIIIAELVHKMCYTAIYNIVVIRLIGGLDSELVLTLFSLTKK